MPAPLEKWRSWRGAEPRRAPPPEPTLVLDRQRIFILPTGNGGLFALVLALMLLGAINYNLSLGHALVFLLAGLGVVGLLHTYRNLVALQLTPGRCEAVFAGQSAAFQLLIDNSRAHPRRALELRFGKNPGVRVDLPASAQALVAVPCPAPRRGRLEPGRLTLATRYPLGLFRAWSTPHPCLATIVYAQPIDTPLPMPTALTLAGQRRGDSGQEDFIGLRLRQPNDSPRHIAWKALARDADRCPLLIKQFAGGAAEELWLDLAQLTAQGGLETQLSILTGWVIAAEQAQLPYGLRLGGRVISPNHGDGHRATCLEAIALHGLD